MVAAYRGGEENTGEKGGRVKINMDEVLFAFFFPRGGKENLTSFFFGIVFPDQRVKREKER